MLVSEVSVMIIAVLEDSVLKFVVDNSDEIVEEVNGGKNVAVMKIKVKTIVVSGVSTMIIAVLEDSVLKFIVDNTDEIVEADDEEKNVEFIKTEDETMVVSGVQNRKVFCF